MASFSGKITYILPKAENGTVSFQLEGMANISKSMLEYPTTPDWQTVWRIYDQYGSLLFEDARHHSIMPFSQADSAQDSFTARVDKSGQIYTIQLYGRLMGEMVFIDQQSVSLAGQVAPTPTPVPQPPPEPAPAPLPPTPVPLPKPPEDGGFVFPDIPDLLPGIGIGAGTIIVIGLALFLLLGRR